MSTRQALVALVALVAGSVLAVTSSDAASSAPIRTQPAAVSTTAYALPLSGGAAAVLRPFEPPPTPYAAGHRGVDLAAASGAAVLAAGDGTISFAGSVAGRGLIVITHPDGVTTEYEPVTPLVRSGQLVARGEVIGQVAGSHDGCPPAKCLHWGARRANAYLDPMSLLRPLGPVRLIPW